MSARRRPPPDDARLDTSTAGEDEAPEEIDEEIVELPITDVLDLHSFPPREIKDLVKEYLTAAYDLGLRRLRIIHGRGIGVQRKTVHTILSRDPRVRAYGDAPAEAGGWGATWIELE